MALWAGNFIRASIWGCCCAAGVFWLNQENWIPNPHQFDAWLRASAWVVGFGALLTFTRFYHRHRRVQADAPLETAPTVTFMSINIEPDNSQHVVELTPQLRGAKQRPRRLPGPTIIDQ
jgi:hypothetical protein